MTQKSVIPQNFLFDRKAGERKFMRNPSFFVFRSKKPNRIPHKLPFALLTQAEEEVLRNDARGGERP